MPDNNEAKWYIIHTFGGYEKKVKTSIENYAKAQDMENIIQEVYLPEIPQLHLLEARLRQQ